MPDVMKTVGRYEILREVGRGGMAMVYLARQTDLDRFVALKELGAFHASDASFAQRFLRESRVAGSLSHPNIVTVHDYFEHDGTPYIAMEYIERGSLRPYVGRMTLAQVGGVLEGLLAGLTHAEAHGIVHRDLKPENLMVTADGRVKIADFGIAKATTRMQTGAFLTATGTTVGTPTYMAPEQAMAQDIGPWTDLYSVGCMAFELFTGRVPFHDSEAPMAILLRHVNEPIPPVKSIEPAVDQRISDWIDKLLVKEPEQRTRSANDAWDEFEEIMIGLLGPRWRREARLVERVEATEGAKPLTPAPFQGTSADGSVSEEFRSFAWGAPDSGVGPMYTPPPLKPPDLPEPVIGPPTPLPSEAVQAAPPPVAEAAAPPAPEVAPAPPPPEPGEDTGFVTFSRAAPPPPSDALMPSPPVDAGPAAEPAAPPVAPAPAPTGETGYVDAPVGRAAEAAPAAPGEPGYVDVGTAAPGKPGYVDVGRAAAPAEAGPSEAAAPAAPDESVAAPGEPVAPPARGEPGYVDVSAGKAATPAEAAPAPGEPAYVDAPGGKAATPAAAAAGEAAAPVAPEDAVSAPGKPGEAAAPDEAVSAPGKPAAPGEAAAAHAPGEPGYVDAPVGRAAAPPEGVAAAPSDPFTPAAPEAAPEAAPPKRRPGDTKIPGFETYEAPPPPRPPTHPELTPPPVAAARPSPAPEAAPARTPEPVAAAPARDDVAPTVMPRALREQAAAAPAKPAEPKEAAPARRFVFPLALVGGIVAAAIIGMVAGGSGGGSEPAPPPPRPTVPVSGAGMTFKVPAGWTKAAKQPAVPGLIEPTALAPAAGGQAIVFGLGDDSAFNSTLLPAELRRGGVPKHAAVDLGGGVQAFRYENALVGGRRGTVFVVPTSQGVATLGCVPGSAAGGQCDAIAQTLRITDGKTFPVGPSKKYAERLSTALKTLEGRKHAASLALKRAKRRLQQAQGADALAAAYAAAAKSLDGLDLSPADSLGNSQLVAALRQVGAAYKKAAREARSKDKAGFKRESGNAADAQATVQNHLKLLDSAGYDVQA